MKHRALAASAATLAAIAISTAVVAAPQAQPAASAAALDLSPANRRAPLPGLPDWSKAGYRGGQNLPTEADHTSNAACRITPEELAALGVRPNDGADDTGGLQSAIDTIRTSCSPSAGYTNLSLITLPPGTLDVTRELFVDADFLTLRGSTGTRVVYRPDTNTRYDTLTPDGSDWDEDGMTCGSGPKGGWLWPGRGLFRVQSQQVHSSYTSGCTAPNRADLVKGTVNVHWKAGVALSAPSRKGESVVRVVRTTGFTVGGLVNVRAANSMKFYEEQQALPTDWPLQNLHMRQRIHGVVAVGSGQITLDTPLEFDLPVDSTSDGSAPIDGTVYASKASPLVDPVVGVGFENFSFGLELNGLPKLGGGTYSVSRDDAVHDYGNIAPEYSMHGIVFKWAADSWVRGMTIEMVGSHPIVTEEAKNIQVVGNTMDGSWNKGKGGNGYLRGSRVWDSLYAGNTTRDLRHFTFQWSASKNVVIGNDFDSDLNLHGGWERHNLFELNTVRVPYDHRSGSCTANCGEEGGGGPDDSTWYPIWWGAGKKAVKWSGATGPQNVFFNNDLAKQTTPGGAYVPYYASQSTVYQFGWNGSSYQHLAQAGTPIPDWARRETLDYTGSGVHTALTDPGPSLFLKSLSTTPPTSTTTPTPPTTTTTTRPPTGGLTAKFSQTNTWSTGYNGQYVITNGGSTQVTSWRIEFDLPAGTALSSAWRADVTRNGTRYTLTNKPYNGTLAPGASTDFGFGVTGTGLPLDCKVNGSPC
ncbi:MULTISPECIES: cellulose binding domain-containing protein [unclassified Saccharothrix]|uniref:cellulose binding domain-containing protein n=1 Tax=unclassified Saccharothrix TaxID=2593673 RepID=UPI00307DA14F